MLTPARRVARHRAASRLTGPPMNIVFGLPASLAHCGSTLYTAVSLGRLRTTPKVPPSLCSTMKITLRRNVGSNRLVLATSKVPARRRCAGGAI
ncbi:Uncharacterised protein [Mycobacteroides abscessus subsp. massiliense]|nr:Uncharacterised protein [Mycobacteroides abscessus subsp. massiliense]